MTTKDEWVNRLREALSTGSLVDLANGQEVDLDDEGHWPADRRVPAEALRTVLLDHDLPADPHGLRIRGAMIDGMLDLQYSNIPYRLTLQDCFLPEGLLAEGSHLRWPDLSRTRLSSLNLDDGMIDGTLNLDKTAIEGGVRAIGATITGQLELNGATLSNPDGYALILDGATINGGLFANGGFTATGELRAPGATITGALDLTDAALSNPDGYALLLDGATINGDIFACGKFTAIGGIRAPGATITGTLHLTDAALSNPDSYALLLDGATINGDIVACGKFTATGGICILAATITGALNLTDAALSNPEDYALSLDGVTVGALFARGDFTATGEVRAPGATITGQLDLTNATLSNPHGQALHLDGATIRGDLFARGHFTATGGIRAPGATITGQLDLTNATLSNPHGHALNLERATVDSLHLGGIHSWEGGLNLDFCEVTVIDFEKKTKLDKYTEPGFIYPSPVSAIGWRVQDIHGDLAEDWKVARDWLDTAPNFASQPWEELARVYDRKGDPSSAKHLRWNAAHRVTKNSPPLSGAWRWLYAATVGYGYYPLLAVGWIIALVIGASLLTFMNPGGFVPTAPTARATITVESETSAPEATSIGLESSPPNECPALDKPVTAASPEQCKVGGYPELEPISYAIATVTPAAALSAPAWTPQLTWLNWTLTGMKLFGWVMTIFLLAGLTGILRKK
ncbi:hypothetical protein FCK90_14395 [Kocuria coralli]|uniref:Oxidoreductase n=1 Tax=Kocuria coralli TaxID=1461025 RepID=A0A5J5KVX2_9MICC|nr:hypothetical protein [Kocuria coralli]KAA9393015.1 hypothetical protein FCK90_14395 [Kocuria coralli]